MFVYLRSLSETKLAYLVTVNVAIVSCYIEDACLGNTLT